MNDHDAIMDDLAMYALGALSEQQARVVREHLSHCDTCRAEYAKMRAVIDVLALGAADPDHLPSPDPQLKNRVMAATHKPQPVRTAMLGYVLAAACLIVAAVLGGFYSASQRSAADLARGDREQRALIADALAPSARIYHVPGGTIVKNGSRLYVTARTMPAPPSGKVYQVWTIRAGESGVQPSVTFVPKNGASVVLLPIDARAIVAIAVTIEPFGGSRHPTSKPLYLRKLT